MSEGFVYTAVSILEKKKNAENEEDFKTFNQAMVKAAMEQIITVNEMTFVSGSDEKDVKKCILVKHAVCNKPLTYCVCEESEIMRAKKLYADFYKKQLEHCACDGCNAFLDRTYKIDELLLATPAEVNN